MDRSEDDKLTPLAPSGISPWHHRALVENGQLALYWNGSSGSPWAGADVVRTFTNEETATLLDLLYNHRDEILAHRDLMRDAGRVDYVRKARGQVNGDQLPPWAGKE